MAKRFRIFIPEKGTIKIDDMRGRLSTQVVIDEETMEQFGAQVIVSDQPEEGYDELVIQDRGGYLPGNWYIKIVERQEDEEEEEITVFESMKLGDRKGYMLRSMMAEKKEDGKKEAMTTELEKRWKQKRAMVDKLLDKKQQD